MENVTIIDNGGRTFDRYRVQFDLPDMDDGELLVGPTGNVPNGVCMWGDGVYPPHDDETVVRFEDVPEPVQRAIVGEIALTEHLRAEWAAADA